MKGSAAADTTMDAFNFTNSQSFFLYAWICAHGDARVESVIKEGAKQQSHMAADPSESKGHWNTVRSLAFVLVSYFPNLLNKLPIESEHWPCWDEPTSRTLEEVSQQVKRFKGEESLALFVPMLNDAWNAIDFDGVAEALLRRANRWPPADYAVG